MKKAALATCLIVAALIFARWPSEAGTKSPPQDAHQPGTSLATSLSLNEMVDQSDLIAIGNCLNTRSMWVDRALVTLATISVTEILKGTDVGTITVALPGGIDANRKFPIAMTYAGAPRIAAGENVFLFLTADETAAGSYSVTGYSQGKFSIAKDADHNQFVTRDLTRTMRNENNGVRRGAAEVTSLSHLKAQVKARLRQ